MIGIELNNFKIYLASYAHQNCLFHLIFTGGDSAVAIVGIIEWESVFNYVINFWFEKHVRNTRKITLVDIFNLPERYDKDKTGKVKGAIVVYIAG